MKEEAMEHGTRQDAENMLRNLFDEMVDDALKAEKKARFEIMADLGIEKADE